MQPIPRPLVLLMSIAGLATLSDRACAHLELPVPSSLAAAADGGSAPLTQVLDTADEPIVEAARREFGFDASAADPARLALARALEEPPRADRPAYRSPPVVRPPEGSIDAVVASLAQVLMPVPPNELLGASQPSLPIDPADPEAPAPVAAQTPPPATERPPSAATLEQVMTPEDAAIESTLEAVPADAVEPIPVGAISAGAVEAVSVTAEESTVATAEESTVATAVEPIATSAAEPTRVSAEEATLMTAIEPTLGPAVPPAREPVIEPLEEANLAPPLGAPGPSAGSQSDRVLRTLAAVLGHEDDGLQARGAADTTDLAPPTPTAFDPAEPSGDSVRIARAALDSPSQHVLRDLAALRDAALGQTSAGRVDPALTQRDTARQTATATGGEPRSASSPLGTAVALDESHLDQMRGGFVTDTGLQVSFGIERAVYVNGTLVTTTSLNVSDLGKVAGGQAAVTSGGTIASGSLALVQNGGGNTFVANAAAGSLGTIVQNTLNDQKIQTLTQINATVNALQVLKSLNFQSSLRSAVTNSLQR